MRGLKNKEEARQCVRCSKGEEESVKHVLLRCTAYRSEREQLRVDGSRTWTGRRMEMAGR